MKQASFVSIRQVVSDARYLRRLAAIIPLGRRPVLNLMVGGRLPDPPISRPTMARKYVAFDIETAKILPEFAGELKAHRPLGIACAATYCINDPTPRVWHGLGDSGQPSPKMSREDAAKLVTALTGFVDAGFTILTWNGLGFDFDILAEESGMLAECRRLACGHVDMMFHFFCERGFLIRLDSAAKAMHLEGKSQGVEPYMAPRLWAERRHQEVLDYVSQDVHATLQLAQSCEAQRCLRWMKSKGGIGEARLPRGWLTVDEARRLPEPDTSWMDQPIPRSRFTDWL
jgi:hypothetical protein